MERTSGDTAHGPLLEAVLAKLDKADPARSRHVRALAAEMAAAGVTPDSPSRLLLERVGERWSVFLLHLLDTGRYRHAEIRRIVNGLAARFDETPISARVLTERLRALERDGLVLRRVGSGKLPPVDYTLTPLGQHLMTHVEPLMAWCAANGERVREAQRDFDARPTMTPAGVHRIR